MQSGWIAWRPPAAMRTGCVGDGVQQAAGAPWNLGQLCDVVTGERVLIQRPSLGRAEHVNGRLNKGLCRFDICCGGVCGHDEPPVRRQEMSELVDNREPPGCLADDGSVLACAGRRSDGEQGVEKHVSWEGPAARHTVAPGRVLNGNISFRRHNAFFLLCAKWRQDSKGQTPQVRVGLNRICCRSSQSPSGRAKLMYMCSAARPRTPSGHRKFVLIGLEQAQPVSTLHGQDAGAAAAAEEEEEDQEGAEGGSGRSQVQHAGRGVLEECLQPV